MHFKRIEIHGFKSFAEPTTIEFDRGITCVVGPNGSGKSNICDAIRWVLGAQSAKALRGERMEDVIFAGTANRKSRGMAEVTLVIDNSEGELDIDYNEVAITRRMYRSGESEYLINNNQCRMKDIRELTMDTGIGVEGYSIIGQGKISDIISNNTESIREILEETAGIVMYRSKKAEAERRLASATSNMERVSDIIGEIEGRIDGLRNDSEKATEYLSLRDRHKQLEINITLKNIDNIEGDRKTVDEDLAELQEQIDRTGGLREEVATRISEGTAQREKVDRDMEETRSRQVQVMEEINRLVNQGEIRSERMAAIRENRQRLEAETADLSEKIQKEEENSRSLVTRNGELESRLAQLRGELDDKVRKHQEQTRSLVDRQQTLDDRKNRLFELQREISSKKVEIASLDSLKETLRERRDTVVEEQDSGDATGRDSRDLLAYAQEAKEGIQRTLDQYKQEKESLRERHGDLQRTEREMAPRLEELKVETGKLSARKKTMEEMEHNYEGYNHAVRFIMKKGIPGIEGVVADLIKVPEGLEVAIETALGGAMQNIICRTDQVAREAIRTLKENGAGRLTFLPVDSIRPRGVVEDASIQNAPGFRGFGATCIEYAEQYRPVMEYLLGAVVIVDDMDHAIELSRATDRRLKIVTLEGEIINAEGAITGGRFKHRSANLLERKAEIKQLEREMSEQEEEAGRITDRLEEIRRELEETMDQMGKKDEEISAQEREFFIKENEIIVLQTSLSDYESNSEKRQRELTNIDEEQQRAERSVEELSRQVEALESEAEELQRTLEEETDQVDLERSRQESEGEAITRLRLQVSQEESEKAKTDAIVTRVTESLAEFRTEKERKEEELARQATEAEELERASSIGGEEIATRRAGKAEIDTRIEELSTLRSQVITGVEEASREKETLDELALSLSNQKSELEVKQARYDTQLENARNKLWDEFEISYAQALDYRDEDFVMNAAVKENREIKKRIRELGEVNVGAIEEYKSVSERYEFLTGQRDDIETSMNELNGIIADMDKIIRVKFKESFDQVVGNFETVFRELYGGGHAHITLGDESDPFESDIEITAQPPGKQLKNINLLSGGEKTMTAIALMFAVLKTKPTPCCVLDEVEAALDDSNLDIFGNYVRKFEGVQFTLITHQKATMEHADVMYGITMPESGVSKVYSLRMEDPVADEPA